MTYKNYLNFTEFLLIARNFLFCICIFSTIIIKIHRFDYSITVHSMHFSSSHLSIRVSAFVFRCTCYLQAPFSISMLFTGSLFWFPCYSQAPFFHFHIIYKLPFSIYMLFAGSLFQFTCSLQATFSHFHIIYRFPFSIYMLFTRFLFGFPCYLQVPFLIYMLFKVFWQPLCIKFTKKSYFTRNLQAI